MSTSTKKRARFAALVLAPIAFLLSACTADFTITVNTDGTSNTVVDFYDEDGQAKNMGITCKDLAKSNGTDTNSKWTVEDLSKGESMHCRLSGDSQQVGTFTDNQDGTVTVSGDANSNSENTALQQNMTTSFTFIMPGDITSASGNGRVDGNKVTYNGPDLLKNGFTITSKKDGSSSSSTSSSTPSSTTAYILLGIGALIVIAAVTFVVLRRKKK